MNEESSLSCEHEVDKIHFPGKAVEEKRSDKQRDLENLEHSRRIRGQSNRDRKVSMFFSVLIQYGDEPGPDSAERVTKFCILWIVINVAFLARRVDMMKSSSSSSSSSHECSMNSKIHDKTEKMTQKDIIHAKLI